MEALKKYMKKSKSHPFGETKPKGSMKGEPKGADQYAKTEGTPVVDDDDADEQLKPSKIKDYSGYGGDTGKKKKREYMK